MVSTSFNSAGCLSMECRRIDLVLWLIRNGNCAGLRAVSGKRGVACLFVPSPCAVSGHEKARIAGCRCLGKRKHRFPSFPSRLAVRKFEWDIPYGVCGVERRYRSAMMGLLDVKGISAPEVKFLDRRRTNGGEGALQVHVRRSRTRV